MQITIFRYVCVDVVCDRPRAENQFAYIIINIFQCHSLLLHDEHYARIANGSLECHHEMSSTLIQFIPEFDPIRNLSTVCTNFNEMIKPFRVGTPFRCLALPICAESDTCPNIFVIGRSTPHHRRSCYILCVNL